MMKHIRVFSRQAFDSYCDEMYWNVEDNFNIFDTDVCVIEILDTDYGINHKSFFKNNHDRILIQTFDDIERGINAFSENQCKEIWKFLEKNKTCSKFIIHCAAGLSRSGAVGMFIYDYFKMYGEKIKFSEYSIVKPNGRISRMLNRYFYDR